MRKVTMTLHVVALTGLALLPLCCGAALAEASPAPLCASSVDGKEVFVACPSNVQTIASPEGGASFSDSVSVATVRAPVDSASERKQVEPEKPAKTTPQGDRLPD
jgi:hypothetical protein